MEVVEEVLLLAVSLAIDSVMGSEDDVDVPEPVDSVDTEVVAVVVVVVPEDVEEVKAGNHMKNKGRMYLCLHQ